MLPLEGRERGKLKQFLSVPVGAECCGPVISGDERTVLVAVQHPGEVSGASPDNVVSNFPYLATTSHGPASCRSTGSDQLIIRRAMPT